MKKLKKVGVALSRNEMRNILGGLVAQDGKKCGACVSAYDCGSGCDACQTGKSGSVGGKCYKIEF